MKLGYFGKTAFVVLSTVGLLTISGFSAATEAPRKIDITAKRFGYEPSEMNLNAKIEKKKTTELAFTPNEPGDFVAHCSVFCGSGHGGMALTIHVTE
jgi:cytochrome c oxidase subunit 2